MSSSSSSANPVVVTTASAQTDAYSTLTVARKGYTDATLQINNASPTDAASFRVIAIATGAVITPEDIVVPANSAAPVFLDGLRGGTTYQYRLERLEFGVYVQQNDASVGAAGYTSVATLSAPLQVSTSSTAVTVQWALSPGTAPPAFSLLYKEAGAAADTGILVPVPDTTTSATYLLSITGLSAATAYTCTLLIRRPLTALTQTQEYDTVSSADFTTATKGSLSAGAPKASSAVLSWVGSPQDTFRIVDASDNVVVTGVKGSANVNITGLLPGASYVFRLEAQVQGEKYTPQASATITTPTAVLTVVSVTSTEFTVQWDPLYEGAVYVARCFETGLPDTTTTTTTANTTTPTSTNATLKGLKPSTRYTVDLLVVEDSVPVPVATLTLSTGAPAPTPEASSTTSASTTSATPTTTPTAGAAAPASASAAGGGISLVVVGAVVVVAVVAGVLIKGKTKK